MIHSIPLDDLRLVAVSGAERASFLQGQLTQDVALANPLATSLAGWADAKGRLLYTGHLFTLNQAQDAAQGNAFALLVPAVLADPLVKRLCMYVLRAKVQVTLPALAVLGLAGDASATVNLPGCQNLQLLHEPARRILVGPPAALAAAPGTRQSLATWHLADIRAGIPSVLPPTSGEFVPQMVNLDLLGGISFTKGCYTGQEIVARTKYLGRVKRRMLRFFTLGEPPAPGAPVYARRGAMGQVVNSAPAETGSEFLAVSYLDDLPGPFFLDDANTQLVRRMELPYAVPELVV